MTITVEDATAGIPIMQALVGNCLDQFEIRFVEDGNYRYMVCGRHVPREVYLDALELAKVDRYEPTEAELRSALYPNADSES